MVNCSSGDDNIAHSFLKSRISSADLTSSVQEQSSGPERSLHFISGLRSKNLRDLLGPEVRSALLIRTSDRAPCVRSGVNFLPTNKSKQKGRAKQHQRNANTKQQLQTQNDVFL